MMKKLFLILITLSFLACQTKQEEMPLPLDKTIYEAEIIGLTDQSQVGEAIEVRIKSSTEIKSLDLIISGKFAVFTIPVSDSKQEILLPKEMIQKAGYYELSLNKNGVILDQKDIYISAKEAVDQLYPFLGPKTISNELLQKAMLITIPRDQFYNIVEDEQKVIYSKRYPNGDLQDERNQTKTLVSYSIISPQSKNGKIILGGASGSAYLPEQEIQIEAGAPKDVQIELLKQFPFADERQHVHLKTKSIKDQAGNVVADGSIITFLVKDDRGVQSSYQSFTVSGIANVYMQNPPYPCTWEISILEDPSSMNRPFKLDFKANIQEIPISQTGDTLKIGPVKGGLNQLIPDGSKVIISCDCGNQKESKELELEGGIAILNMQEFCSEKMTNCSAEIGLFKTRFEIK